MKNIPHHSLILLFGNTNKEIINYYFDDHEILNLQQYITMLFNENIRYDIYNEAIDGLINLINTKLYLGERVLLDFTNIKFSDRFKITEYAKNLNLPIFYIFLDKNFSADKSLFNGDDVAEIIDERYPKFNVFKKIENLENHISSYSGITVIPDVHGMYESLKDACNWAHKNNNYIIFLGDVIDYGPKSLDCINLVYDLITRNNASFILGNHEVKISRWISDKTVNLTEANLKTINLLNNLNDLERKKWISKFKTIFNLAYNHINYRNFCFSHGGVYKEHFYNNDRLLHGKMLEMSLYGERFNNKRTFEWCNNIPENKTVVVGHTIRSTLKSYIHKNKNNSSVIFLDSGCGKNGQLITMDIKNDKIRNYNYF